MVYAIVVPPPCARQRRAQIHKNVYKILGIANNKRWIGLPCLTLINGEPVYNRVLIVKECQDGSN